MTAIVVLILRVIMAAALYAFVGWAFYTLWRSLKVQSEDLALRRTPPLSICLEGESSEKAHHFTGTEVVIGRDAGCDCSIPDETISARHARLSYHHKQWWVEDLYSTNGTYLNQEPLTTSTVIVTEDELRCGQVNMTIIIGGRG